MSRFISIPSEIDAVQWTGYNWPEILAFAGSKVDMGGQYPDELRLLAGKDGAQEWVPVPVGHWLVCQPNDKRDIWPVDPDYFAAKYTPRCCVGTWNPILLTVATSSEPGMTKCANTWNPHEGPCVPDVPLSEAEYDFDDA